MTVESASHIDELDPSTTGSTTDPTEGGDQIALIKTVLKADFGNVSGAVTASDVDMNRLDIATEGTAQASRVLTASATSTIDCTGITWTNLGTVTTMALAGGTINATPIGGTTPAAGAFTTLSASGAVDFNSGAIDGVTVGATSPSTGAFTTLTASGNVTFIGGTINGIPIGGSTPSTGVFTTLQANTSLVLNGSTPITSVDTDLSSVSASHDTIPTAKAVKEAMSLDYACLKGTATTPTTLLSTSYQTLLGTTLGGDQAWSTNVANGITSSPANGYLEIARAGNYQLNIGVTWVPDGTPSTVLELGFTIGIDSGSGIVDQNSIIYAAHTNDIAGNATINLVCIPTLAAGDKLYLRVRQVTGTEDAIFTHANITLHGPL